MVKGLEFRRVLSGFITQTGALLVGGNGSFTTSAANATITLNGANDIAGTMALSTNGATGNASITELNGINFAASSVGGNLTATATTGNISHTGMVSVAGRGSFTTSNPGAISARDM